MQKVQPEHHLEEKPRILYERAANTQEACLTSDNIFALVTDEVKLDDHRMDIVHYLLLLLKRDLWARLKYEVDYQPSRADRILILKLQMVAEFDLINKRIDDDERRFGQPPQVPQVLFTTVSEEEAADIGYCYICRDAFGTQGDDGEAEYCVKTFTCNHTFGNGCLIKWLKHNKPCPTCRRRLEPRPQQPAEGADRLIRFNAFFHDMINHIIDIVIDRAGTPRWMIALLAATDIVEAQYFDTGLGRLVLYITLQQMQRELRG